MSTKIAVLLSDFIRAESGDQSAVFETRVQVAQSAVFHLLSSNNKTQWNIVTAACKMYADPEACAAALNETGPNPATGKAWTTASAPVKRMNAVYLAYGAAIDSLELPAFVKGRPVAEIEAIASDAALQVATLVTGALTVAPKEPVTEADKAKKEQAKKDKADKAQAEAQAAIDAQVAEATAKAQAEAQAAIDAQVAEATAKAQAEAQAAIDANALTLADMVRTVANAVRSGMLDAESLAMLDGALDAAAVTVEHVETITVLDTEPAHA